MTSFPIVEQRALATVRPRFMRPLRRDLSELPEPQPGTVLVASGDETHTILHRIDLTSTNASFVHASSIAVVDMKASRVTVEVEVDSKIPGALFVVHVVFSCRVTDPVDVVRSVAGDLGPILQSKLKRDTRLLNLGSQFDVDQIAPFRRQATARVKSWFRTRPPDISGMEIQFEEVDVVVPADLRRWAESQRDERRRQELERMRKIFGHEQAKLSHAHAELIEEVLARGPEAIEALFLELDDKRYETSANRAYGERQTIDSRFHELLGMLGEAGQFDRLAVDTPQLLNEIVGRWRAARGRRLDTSTGDGDAKDDPLVVLGDGPPASSKPGQRLGRGDVDEGAVRTSRSRALSDVDGDDQPPDTDDVDI